MFRKLEKNAVTTNGPSRGGAEFGKSDNNIIPSGPARHWLGSLLLLGSAPLAGSLATHNRQGEV